MIKIKLNGTQTPHVFNVPGIYDDTWRDAIELHEPPVVDSRHFAIPQYNYNTNPIEITYSIIEATVSERKNNELTSLKQQFVQLVNEHLHTTLDNVYDFEMLKLKNQEMLLKITDIEAATTHDELDAIV